ncbi:MAG: single-stranded-DNA-specific exonuclease RecJ, partial [Deltaproteobacteria bacterium]|nr:single-stranded-DNA-specific exonuclease RecJ [Deltaproteobacteria bacterium]
MTPPSPQSIPARWIIAEPDHGALKNLQDALHLPELVARVLVNRGIETPEAATAFLAPTLKSLNDPLQMRDMDRAVRRVMDAFTGGETICIHGDYDADGMTSTALLASFFEQAGHPVRTFLPDRMTDGYGLNPDRLKEMVRDGVNLIIAVDCGTTAISEANLLKSLGADLVILDHHTPGPALPDAAAVVNPHRKDCEFPFKDLSAVGVAFYFAGAMRRALTDAGMLDRDGLDIRLLLDLVAVGTICDAVPLLSDNRVFVSAGLRLLNEGPRLGLAALKAVAGIRNRPVTSGIVGYQLGPRLNAIGRLGNPGIGLDLLLAHDPEEATRHADVLDRENEARREVGEEVLAQAFRQVEEGGGPLHKAVVVSGEGWHPGVVGIAASRLVETYRRPAVVIGVSDGIGKGSCRSIRGFDIGAALAGMSGMFIRHGGHPM